MCRRAQRRDEARLEAVRQLRLINHPELRKGMVAWGSMGEASRSQEDKKSRCLAIRSFPHHVDFFQIKKVISGNSSLADAALYPNSFRHLRGR